MRKSLASGLLLAGVLVSGAASAAPWTWSGTLADWGAAGGGTGVITDGDGDVSFTLFNTTTIPDGVNGYVTISEVEIGGADYYDVGLSWDASTGFAGGYAGGGQLVYAMDVLAPSTERIVAAALDSAITGTGTTALAVLRDLPSNTLITNLASFDGAHDPVTGYAGFSGRTSVGMQQLWQPTQTGVFQDTHASFVVANVPEPSQWGLVGLALAALVFTRRRAG